MHYPSKQTIIIFVVCIAALAGTVIYVGKQAPKKTETNIDQHSIFARAQDEFASTTIGTTTDWKSAFIEAGTSSASFKLPKKSVATATTSNLTATENFGRGLFAQYVSLKQVGLNSNTDIVSSTISSLIAQSDATGNQPREYSLSDIIVSSDKSTSALKTYGNTVGQLLKTYSPARDDATIALAGMQGTDSKYVEELGANIVKYKMILTTLLNTSAPQSVSQYHLALVNGASYMIFISSALQASQTDPFRALNGLKLYSTAYPLILQNMIAVRATLGLAGITYSASEGGSFFNLKTQ